MKKVSIFLITTLIVISCGLGKKKQANAENEKDVLRGIYTVIDDAGFVELPYKTYYGQKGAIFIESNLKTLYGIGWIYGVLPDTSLFYGILFDNGVSETPFLTTFDKRGNLIISDMLGEENSWEKGMVGEIILCEEYTIVNKDLTLHYYFNSKHLYEGNSGEYDVLICENFEKRGKINTAGKIIFEEKMKIVDDCENNVD